MAELKELTMELTGDVIEEKRRLGEQLQQNYAERDAMFTEIEAMFHMEWSTKLNDPSLKKTINPDPKNAVKNAVRLLTSTEPVWKVTLTEENPDKKQANQLEHAAKMMWKQAAQMRGKAVHRDMVFSATLYDEVHVAISSLTEWAKALDGRKKERMELAAQKTPFSLEVWNPHEGYPMFDQVGVTGYYRVVEQSAAEAIATHGAVVQGILDKNKKKVSDQVEVALWYDLESYILWIDGTCVVSEKMDLPFLPIDVTIVEGSSLFEGGVESREPLLKTVWQSKHWENTNLTNTLWYTNIAKYGLVPTHEFKQTMANGVADEDPPSLDASRGIVETGYGWEYRPINRQNLVNPDVLQGMQLSEQKMEESTMYRTAAGQSLGKNASFSMTSLLSQSGRLPLTQIKVQVGEAIGKIVDICLRWYKDMKVDCPGLKLKPSDVPEGFEITVDLEINLPQDKLQNANTATMLKDKGLASERYVQEEFLQITDSAAMKQEIWTEQAAQVLFDLFLKTQVQQMANGGQQSDPEGMPPQGMPGGMPGGMSPMGMQSAQPKPGGMAMQGGLPQVQGGMLPMSGPGEMVPGQMPSVDNPIKGRRVA